MMQSSAWIHILQDVPRCLVTGHPCGTDTWARGSSCPCAPCQAFVARTEAQRRWWATTGGEEE